MASTLDAYLFARRIEAHGAADDALTPLWDQISLSGKARTAPENVQISLKVAMDDPQWIDIGTSGQADFRFPRGQFFWRLEKPGYHTKTLYGDALFLFAPGIGADIFSQIALAPDTGPLLETISEGVTVPAGVNYVTLPFQEVPEFKVSRFEVTNREFKEFVQSGGYDNPVYWQALADANSLDALETFVDRTGRPGPATWEVGTYPSGKADHPVGGVSWYEATAYAGFRNASLPTIYHWAQAALPIYASTLGPLSNLNSEGEISTKAGPPGPWGTFGTYGNVREWVINAWDDRRWILGGGWSDPAYLASLPFSLPPADRSPVNGIRLYYFEQPFPDEFSEPVHASYNDYRSIKPVSNDTYAVIADQYVDVGGKVESKVVARVEGEEWVRETIRISSDIPGEHFDLHLFLPRDINGPSQIVTYFPPISDFWAAADSADIDLRNRYLPLDTIPRSGRALAWPVYYGSFERYFGIYEMSGARRAQLQTEMRVHWYADLKRSLDYLETREDVAIDRLAWLSYSYGASHALPLLALEKRYDAAILVGGGLGNLGIDPMPQAADPLNFISRIETPVLMINGKNDFVFPLDSSQRPLFELLGTLPQDKVKIEYDGDHYQIPATAMTRDMANWLDERLGPP